MKLTHVALLLAATTTAAEARVTRIEIVKREPFAAGQAFGATGAYEKIVGRYQGALELCYLEGSFIAFAKTKAEREAKKDPRPSLEERYKDRADYAERVRKVASELQRDSYLLEEDAARIVSRAASVAW